MPVINITEVPGAQAGISTLGARQAFGKETDVMQAESSLQGDFVRG